MEVAMTHYPTAVIDPIANSHSDRLLSLREVEAITSLGRSTIYRLIDAQAFPRQVHLGRYSRWSAKAIERWIEQQLAAAE